ncbi:hypothetical protein HMPREF2955_10900 [Prevotella sp. HMSC073D09]|nr:hypothetical protein HMPREF2955_10900 [Prevotella sp. HMSC073D09]
MAAFLNKNSFCRIHILTPLCVKTNPRENRFFAARWAIGDEKDTHNVKFFAENQTKLIVL